MDSRTASQRWGLRSAARRDVVVELVTAHGTALRRTALRCSLCADDADDALQRAIEILIVKGPLDEPVRLVPWMHVVTRREALALRRVRERLLGPGPRPEGAPPDDQPLALVACERPGPAESTLRRERVGRAARSLEALKPQERTAIILQAQGYSYAEICRICGWTYTKVNRCLAEGRARLRELESIA